MIHKYIVSVWLVIGKLFTRYIFPENDRQSISLEANRSEYVHIVSNINHVQPDDNGFSVFMHTGSLYLKPMLFYYFAKPRFHCAGFSSAYREMI